MKTVLLLDERRNIAEDRFVELMVWQVPQPVRASTHVFKYRLAFVVDGMCVVRSALRRFHGRRDELENLR